MKTDEGQPLKSEPIEVKKDENAVVKEVINGGFHIIAGAFSSEANANRMADKYRAEGYSVNVGLGRGMNLVSIKSFSTKAAANAGLTDLKSAVPKGWVYEWK